jgi:hypothetical protein
VLLLEGQREPVDDGPEDLEQLRDAIVVLCLVDKPVNRQSVQYFGLYIYWSTFASILVFTYIGPRLTLFWSLHILVHVCPNFC